MSYTYQQPGKLEKELESTACFLFLGLRKKSDQMIRDAEYSLKTQILLKNKQTKKQKKVIPKTKGSALELSFGTDVTGMETTENLFYETTNLITQSGWMLGEARGGAMPLCFNPFFKSCPVASREQALSRRVARSSESTELQADGVPTWSILSGKENHGQSLPVPQWGEQS